jgi:hypothetical protein
VPGSPAKLQDAYFRGTIYTCKFDSLAAPDGFASITDVSYRAADGAKAGAEGSVTLKVTSRRRSADHRRPGPADLGRGRAAPGRRRGRT